MKLTRKELAPGDARIFIPSLPTRWDAVSCRRVSVYNLNNAAPYGTLITLSTDNQDVQEALLAIERGLADFNPNDAILAIGDVTRILAACLVVEKTGWHSVRLLQWDKRRQQYFATEVDFE